MKFNINDLDFGALAAEREKSNLPSLFISSIQYQRLKKGSNKIIVLGNRGSGKTALLSMIAENKKENGYLVIELTPEDYSYELFSKTIISEKQGAWHKHSAYAAAWKLILYVLSMKKIIASKRGLKTGSAKKIYRFLCENYKGVESNPIGALISYLKRLEGIKIGKYEASFKARELQRLYKLEDIEYLLDDLNDLCKDKPLIILIDELDRGWDSSEDAVAFVAGLFQASTSIRMRTPNIRVVMSLRKELFDNIPTLYDDAQKVRDTIEVINWTKDLLLNMICKRIKISLGITRKYNDEDVWYMIMPLTINGYPSFDYIISLTLYRPRELIYLCTQILDLEISQTAELPFAEENILTAIDIFAEQRFQDIVAEYRFQYPDIGSIFETFRSHKKWFTADEMDIHCMKLSLEETKVSRKAEWCLGLETEKLINIFWTVGFIQCGIRNTNNKYEYFGSHHRKTINTRNVQRYKIHELYAIYLNCSE